MTSEATGTKDSCTCQKCQNACRRKPGWFLPDEVEKAAEYLGLPSKDFFEAYLGIDWYYPDNWTTEIIFILAPALLGTDPGAEYPSKREGTCTFLEDGRCKIHPVRPYECREYVHSEPNKTLDLRHADVASVWKGHLDQIIDLLGWEPFVKVEEPSFVWPLGEY